ncbi:glutamyl-tRNA reductase [Microbacterium rhizosphaerae]|uniref:Glutamyl-tRNA reductase n=1 Tax=Microbacterium rhizosphaerae TaxID=1678237 RepID=A0ABZ0SHD3_9MICO|nr:glutamyl-tRNA reductase [Microbacterium rhizosphaerae]WPR88619.1 glutamyl-tRNA reductase [Microbacterium rhizosphaerae]
MLFCLTANHRNTDFDVLDRISHVTGTDAADRIAAHDFVRGVIVLSTCNRFEAYLELDESLLDGGAVARTAVIDALRDAGVDAPDADALAASAGSVDGDDVVHHLFAVASGLESMVVGEEEINGQVQRSLSAARTAGTTSTLLEQAFQRAAHSTRAVRAKADVAAGGRSLARIALDLAGSRVTDWSTVRVLLVGTGQYAATTITALRARGAEDVRVFSATGRGEKFALKYAVRAERDLGEAIARADIVLTCTARYVITADDIPDSSPRLIVDLGLPRNVDPAVGALPGVELMDLELLGRHAVLPELGPGAHELVGNAAATFTAERAAASAVVAVRTHIQKLLDAELARTSSSPDADAVAAALRHFAGVLSHTPSVRARELAAEGRIDEFEAALGTVFGLDVAPRLRAIDDERAAG